MDCLATFNRLVNAVSQRAIGEKRARFDGTADAGKFLVNHAPGTQVQVTNLGITHLVSRQSNGRTRGTNQRVGKIIPQAVPDRLVRSSNGIELWCLTKTPAVEDKQYHRSRGSFARCL